MSPPARGEVWVSAVLCEAVRSISVERLVVRRGAVEGPTMAAVAE